VSQHWLVSQATSSRQLAQNNEKLVTRSLSWWTACPVVGRQTSEVSVHWRKPWYDDWGMSVPWRCCDSWRSTQPPCTRLYVEWATNAAHAVMAGHEIVLEPGERSWLHFFALAVAFYHLKFAFHHLNKAFLYCTSAFQKTKKRKRSELSHGKLQFAKCCNGCKSYKQLQLKVQVALKFGNNCIVWRTDSSLASFLLTTVIHRKRFVVTKRVFWAQNITHVRLWPDFRLQRSPRLPSWLREGERRKGKGKGRGKEEKGAKGRWRKIGSIPAYFISPLWTGMYTV